jgi:hypothetical protein
MYDIFYISDQKTDYFRELKAKFPLLKHSVTIRKAQQRCLTEFFWVVWDNLIVEESFDFSYVPDNWSKEYIHTFLNDIHYDGIILCPKTARIMDKEIDHRFFINKKEVNIVASRPRKYDVFEIDSYEEYQSALDNSTTEMFWMSSRNIAATIPDLYFSYNNSYDRKINHVFVHQVGDKQLYNGLFLCSKHAPLTSREIEHRHPVNRKEWDIVGSTAKKYDVFEIDSYEEYQHALKNSKTEMFWMSSRNIAATIPDIYFDHSNTYDRKTNHVFVHQVGDKQLYNGLFLCSKHAPLTSREIDHRHIVNRKEWDIVGSGPVQYDIFYTKTYQDYLDALQNSKTEMFWIVPDYATPVEDFKFDTYFSFDEKYERTVNHAYLNGKYHDGIILCSKYAKFSKKEFDYKFISHKKEVNIIVSKPNPFDIVFISYQEPNADENYKLLVEKFPNAKRIHGVKGIHQAHIEAAKLCKTDMFWIVDGDALIDSKFKFDYQVARWDKETVHVWRSINPINDLVYGYGGVKLFPRELTLNMDITEPDMTTSISSKFKAVEEISNITAFNTDPFNTWKSAFRECVKLSSKVITRQDDEETAERLFMWKLIGENRPFGKYAIAGAKAGEAYGSANKDNLEALKMINNFDWLQEQFNNVQI